VTLYRPIWCFLYNGVADLRHERTCLRFCSRPKKLYSVSRSVGRSVF